jgi:hypothetical protein
MKESAFKENFKTFLVILSIFLISRFIIFSSIIFIRNGPLSPDSKSFKWVSEQASIYIPFKFTRLVLCGDSCPGQKIYVYLNNTHISTLSMYGNTDFYLVDIEQNIVNENNILQFVADKPGLGIHGKTCEAWRLWDIRTNADFSKNILTTQNLMYSQEIKTEGISSSQKLDSQNSIKEALRIGLSKWDANMYIRIVNDGYTYDGNNTIMHNIVFPYIFPLLTYILKISTGLDTLWAGALINNTAFFISLILLYIISKSIITNEVLRFMPLVFMALNPFSIFSASAFSEGLFIMFTLLSIILLKNKKYFSYSLAGGALNGIRVVGIVAPLVLIFDYFFIQRNKITLRNIAYMVSLSLLSIWGLLTFILYSTLKFNEPFAMFKNQHAWTPGALKLEYAISHILEPVVNISKFMEPQIAGMGAAVFVAGLCIVYIIKNWRDASRLELILAVFCLFLIIIPLVFYNKTESIHNAMGRYAFASFPSIALLFKGRHREYNAVLILIPTIFCTFELIIFTMRFAWGFTPY